jgi:hypothetical protein
MAAGELQNQPENIDDSSVVRDPLDRWQTSLHNPTGMAGMGRTGHDVRASVSDLGRDARDMDQGWSSSRPSS